MHTTMIQDEMAAGSGREAEKGVDEMHHTLTPGSRYTSHHTTNGPNDRLHCHLGKVIIFDCLVLHLYTY